MSPFLRRPAAAFVRAIAQHLPENFLQLGFALATRSMAITALTSVAAVCGASEFCNLAANQGGELAIDVAATGIAVGALALGHHIAHHAAPLLHAASFAASALTLADPGFAAFSSEAGQMPGAFGANYGLEAGPKLV